MLAILFFSLGHDHSFAVTLADLEWRYRLLFVSATSDERGEKIVSVLQREKAEVKDRELLWIVFINDKHETNQPKELDKEFLDEALASLNKSNSMDQEQTVIIGFDGQVKARDTQFDFDQIKSIIDSMPMRR
ncbi:MAG: DUF4174 domain-containing protein [Pseudomonadota bacterium]